MVIFIESIHYYNYRMGIEPTYLSVFEMMSGLVTPHSIGLNDEKSVLKLLKTSRILFKITRFVQKYNLPFMGIIGFIPYIIYGDLFDIILFGIPHTIMLSLATYYACRSSLWHLIYFYILCYYMKIKIQSLNENLRKQNINEILNKFHSLHKQIQEYNENFWSKYLLCIWLLMGGIVINAIFIILFISTAHRG